MKIAVMGAGAVGCYYGGMLARGGHEVVLIARPQHVEAIERDGLRLQTRGFDEHVRVSASTEASAVEGASVVLFCVKSIDTESAAAGLGKYLGPDALVLTLQNGVENADLLRTLIQQEVAATVVYVAAEMAGPGHVLHHGRGELIIEPSRTSEEIARVFSAAGVPTEISDNVRGALWAKLILNCAYNALSAIAHVTYGELVQNGGVPQIMNDVVDECLAVAKADGVSIPGDPHEAVQRLAASMPAQYSSTAQDLSRGKRTEIDHLNGLVVRRGEALGVPTPVNRVLHTLVKLIEGKRAGMPQT
jgi:2-dehydropantoate 2-reductase